MEASSVNRCESDGPLTAGEGAQQSDNDLQKRFSNLKVAISYSDAVILVQEWVQRLTSNRPIRLTPPQMLSLKYLGSVLKSPIQIHAEMILVFWLKLKLDCWRIAVIMEQFRNRCWHVGSGNVSRTVHTITLVPLGLFFSIRKAQTLLASRPRPVCNIMTREKRQKIQMARFNLERCPPLQLT